MDSTEHLTSPKQLLDLDDDVLFHICLAIKRENLGEKDALSKRRKFPLLLVRFCSTCKRLRNVGAPLIFRKATVLALRGCYVQVFEPAGWRLSNPTVWAFLDYLQTCENLPRSLKDLDFEVKLIHGDDEERLSKALHKLVNLTKLRVAVVHREEKTEHSIVRVLQSSAFPQLHTLALSAELEEAIPHLIQFSSLTSLSISRLMDLDPAGATSRSICNGWLHNIEHLDLCDMDWTPAVLNTLSTHMPQLRSLGTIGNRPKQGPRTKYRTEPRNELFKEVFSLDHLHQFSDISFPSLRTLVIGPPEHKALMDLASNLADRCDVYQNSAYVVIRNEHTFDVDRCIAGLVFQTIRNLQVLWVGEQQRGWRKKVSDTDVTIMKLASDTEIDSAFWKPRPLRDLSIESSSLSSRT